MADSRMHVIFLVNFLTDAGGGIGGQLPVWHKQETLIKKNCRPLPRTESAMFRFILRKRNLMPINYNYKNFITVKSNLSTIVLITHCRDNEC